MHAYHRAARRLGCDRPRLVRFVSKPGFASAEGQLADVSVQGVGLRCRYPVPLGSELALDWRLGTPDRHATLLARVVHVTWNGADGWLIGCALARPLPLAALHAFLASQLAVAQPT
jgi:hypothetical protein